MSNQKHLTPKKSLQLQSLPTRDLTWKISPLKKLIAGVDEAGRGPWAGPVVAGAVVWPEGVEEININDSKQLSSAMREQLFLVVQEKAIAVGIGMSSVEEIDRVGIGVATKLAMNRAVENLSVKPDVVLVDGYRVEFEGIESIGMIDGDAQCLQIAAASIVAKVARDRMMVELAQKYPQYGFEQHKGYGTALHQSAIQKFGVLDVHRKSFAPIRNHLLIEQT